MRKNTVIIVCVFLMIGMLIGCDRQIANENTELISTNATEDSKTLPAGLYVEVEGVPGIDEFSDSVFQMRRDQYPSIASVRYYANETSTEIPIDDGRVFRLLNFIGRSLDDGSFGMKTGYEEADSIAQWYENPEPMLEITFVSSEDSEKKTGLALCTRMLIRGGTVLEILDRSCFDDGSEKGVLLWPYNALFGEKGIKYMGSPEKELWIDMLVFARFSDKK